MLVGGEMDMAGTKTSQETATGTVMLIEGGVDMAESDAENWMRKLDAFPGRWGFIKGL